MGRTMRGRSASPFAIRMLAVAVLCGATAGCSGWDYAMGASYGGTAAAGAAGAGGAASAAATTGTVIAGGTGLYVSISLGTAAANIMAVATGAAIYAAMLQESGEFQLRRYEMLEGRAINEQDCTKPITNMQANLKCK